MNKNIIYVDLEVFVPDFYSNTKMRDIFHFPHSFHMRAWVRIYGVLGLVLITGYTLART